MYRFIINSTGKKKCSCAKVFLQYNPSESFFSVNNKNIDEFFYLHRDFLLKPLILVNCLNSFFIKVNVKGGGFSSQLFAIRHGISKALVKFADYIQLNKIDVNDVVGENFLHFRKFLKNANFLTRDARIVERKKFGHKKARKQEQYSKR